MLLLDMRTIVIIYVLVNYICTFSLFLVWFKNKQEFKGLSLIVADFIFQSIGMTLAGLYGSISPYLSVVIANLLMFSGGVLFLFGIAKFLDMKINRNLYAGYIALFTVLYSYFGILQPSVRFRILIFNIMIIPIFLHIIKLVFSNSKFKNRSTAYNIGITFILFTLIFSLRAYFGFIGDELNDYFSSIKIDDILVVLSLLCTILLTFSVNVMINNELLQYLKVLSVTDPLTKIKNRRATETIMQAEIEKQSNEVSFCVLLIDIDDFKRLNDTYGHDVGDQALIHITSVLGENIREKDSLGRWGGEEFVIVLPNTNITTASTLAGRLVDVINRSEFRSKDKLISITVSIGVSEYKENSTIELVLKNADTALYRAKKNGKNRYECSS